MGALLFSAWHLVVRRSVANLRLLASIIVGILLAVTLLASAPLYAEALSSLGLAHQLRQRPLELLTVHVIVNNQSASPDEYRTTDSRIRQEVQRRLEGVIGGEARYARSAPFYQASPDETEAIVTALETQERVSQDLLQAQEEVTRWRRVLQQAQEAAAASQSPAATAALKQAEKELETAKAESFEAQTKLDRALAAAEQAQRATVLAERALVPGDERRLRALEEARAREAAALEEVTRARRELTQARLIERVTELRTQSAQQDAERTQDPVLRQRVREAQEALRNAEARLRDEDSKLQQVRRAAGEVLRGESRDRAYLQFLTGLEDHVRLVEGRWPAPFTCTTDAGAPQCSTEEIEVLMGQRAAEAFGLRVGDRFSLIPSWQDLTPQLQVRIVGLIEQLDPKEAYWMLEDPLLAPPPGENGPQWRTHLLFVPEESYFGGLVAVLPGHQSSTYSWRFFIERDRITPRMVKQLEEGLKLLERDLVTTIPGANLQTVLREELARYQTKLVFTQVPVYLVLLQVAGIILYYVTMVSNMLVERRARDVAYLKERGASTGQIFTIHLMEGLLICGAAFLLAPFLAVVATALLGRTPAFRVLSGGGLMPVGLSPAVFAFAAIAAGLSLLALLFPALQVARLSSVSQRHALARPPRAPWWQRYQIDLVALLLGAVLYWQIGRQGALLNRSLFGQLSFDPFQLLTPTLLMIALGIAFLRLFPVLLRLMSRLLARGLATPLFLALLYVGRNPLPYTRLVLLLVLITALGVFVAIFGGTLERSLSDRVHYRAGGEVRVAGLRNYTQGPGAFLAPYRDLPGVEVATPVWRGDGRLQGRRSLAVSANNPIVLAIEPASWEQVAWYRRDFADKPLPEVTALLKRGALLGDGLALPPESVALSVWVQPASPCPDCRVLARLRDSQGTYWDLELGPLDSPQWRQLKVDLPAVARPPLYLSALSVRLRGVGTGGPDWVLRFDAVETWDRAGSARMLEDFEGQPRWESLPRGTTAPQAGAQARAASGDVFSLDSDNAYQGRSAGRLQLGRAATGVPGIQFKRTVEPLPAIASRSFLETAGTGVGGPVTMDIGGRELPLRIVAVVDYFPTLDPAAPGFLVLNLEHLSRAVNYAPLPFSLYPNEVWLATSGGRTEREALLNALSQVVPADARIMERQALLAEARADPLTSAGWRGVLNLAFLAAALVGALGFFVYSYLFAQQRQVEFAVLRSLGLSPRQIGWVVGSELFLVVSLGVGAGTLVGLFLGRLIVPFLQLTELGERVLPSFVVTLSAGEAARMYAVLLLSFLLASAAVARFFSQLALTRALRLGE